MKCQAMIELKLNSRRMSKRYRLTGLLPGKLIVLDTSKHLSARAVDVSKEGIGVISASALQVGDLLLLVTACREFPLKVLQMRKDYAKSGRFRYGLVIDPSYSKSNIDSINFVEVFQNSGCMLD